MTTLEKNPAHVVHQAQTSFQVGYQYGVTGFREAYYAYNLTQDVQRYHQRLSDCYASPLVQGRHSASSCPVRST